MKLGHYDKAGNLLDLWDWAKLMEDSEYKRVALTKLPSGTSVSTVWLGLDHRFGGDGPPLIFETMVFPSDNADEMDCERYATEQQAMDGHAAMVERWKDR